MKNNETELVKRVLQYKDKEAIFLKYQTEREEAQKKMAEEYTRNSEMKKRNEEIKKWLDERNKRDEVGENPDGYRSIDY
jgi:hypothetical protein